MMNALTLPGAAEDVYAAVFEEDEEARDLARRRLASMYGPYDAVVMGLMGALAGGTRHRMRALEALAAMGDRAGGAADVLRRMCMSETALTMRMVAAAALARVCPGSPLDATAFGLALVLGEREERLDAIAILGELGPLGAPAVPALLKVLEQPDLTARQQATLTLGKIGIEALARVLACPVPPARRHAVLLLASRPGEMSRAVPAVVRALKDRDRDVRRTAAVALGRCGVWARCAIPDLVHTLEDRDPEVRWWTAIALAGLGLAVPPVVTALVEARDQAPVDLRNRAADVLTRMGWAAKRAA